MKLERFKEKKQKKIGMIVGISSIILLLAVVFVYRTYSIYQEKQEFDVIRGGVPDQNYDVMFSFYLIAEDGIKKLVETIPEGKDYRVDLTCNHEATGVWDEEKWGPVITNLTNTRTKCNIIFKKLYGPLKDYGIIGNTVTEGSGLYEVSHEDASIVYTTDETAIANLKKTEYRYAGSSPNNYVTFNDEVAGRRLIGLVNTPEGQRLKLIRDESIGNYSWDSSTTSINNGNGVNEWSQSDLNNLLNKNVYYNRTSGKCYTGNNLITSSCNFTQNGLTEETKAMIDSITWNTGTQGVNNYLEATVNDFYNYERSSNHGKRCSGFYCNDTVTRTTSWKGQVGLMYPSDYGYATSGGNQTNRATCLMTSLNKWNEESKSDCKEYSWIYKQIQQWTILPSSDSTVAGYGFSIGTNGNLIGAQGSELYKSVAVRPSVYLVPTIKIINGVGTQENPYTFS